MINMQCSFHMLYEQSGQGWYLRRYGELNSAKKISKGQELYEHPVSFIYQKKGNVNANKNFLVRYDKNPFTKGYSL